jgi:lipopolysaccharide/colanic/teichoic acid biosynthesis glycosyltransferase
MKAIKILYIGDNESYKEDYGFNVEMVATSIQKENGFLAYDYLIKMNRKDLPDFIFCESNISGITPYQLHKRIRDSKVFDKVSFILVNDSITKKEGVYAIKQGVDEIMVKPFALENYFQRLSFLSNYRQLNKKERKSSRTKKGYKIPTIKRVFDVTVAGSALLAISPVLLITMAAMKMESRGPWFYSSKRVGTGYKIFDFYKFRSMYVDAEDRLKDLKGQNQYAEAQEEVVVAKKCPDCIEGKLCSPALFVDGKEICEKHHLRIKKADAAGTFIKIKDDPRITKVGRIIRNTSIDELPQLINVLKGDMSIVGNRPLPLYEAEQLTSDNWAERFMAPAGITGLWQVEKRGGGEMSEEERKGLDNKYARNHSFGNDIKLILRTIPALFQSENV